MTIKHIAIPAFLLALSMPGCFLSHAPEPSEPASHCWTSGTVTEAPDRDRCFDTLDACYQDAERWGALTLDPWACE
jgi:hypothetical protein